MILTCSLATNLGVFLYCSRHFIGDPWRSCSNLTHFDTPRPALSVRVLTCAAASPAFRTAGPYHVCGIAESRVGRCLRRDVAEGPGDDSDGPLDHSGPSGTIQLFAEMKLQCDVKM